MRSYFQCLTCLILTGLFFVPAKAQESVFDTTIYGKNPAAGHYLSTRGVQLYYETYGSGEPLLIIHGNGGSINNFVYQIPYFAQHYKVILADSRSQGKTKYAGDSLTYEMMADDLNALLDSLHADSARVIGWSDGGINGLLLAIRHPKKVKQLAITGANLSPDSSAVDPFIWKWAQDYYKKIQAKAPSEEKNISLKLTNLLVNQPHIPLSDLHKIKCATLVIGGDHDVIRTEHTVLIAANIANAYLWILPNSGHSTPIFYKDEFNKTVGDFFAKPFRTIKEFGKFE